MLEQLTNQLGDGLQSIQAKKQDLLGADSAGDAGSTGGAGRDNKNLSSTEKLKN